MRQLRNHDRRSIQYGGQRASKTTNATPTVSHTLIVVA